MKIIINIDSTSNVNVTFDNEIQQLSDDEKSGLLHDALYAIESKIQDLQHGYLFSK
jgi:hypothetical protein